MTVVDAIEHVKKQRWILPNRGFLKQLRDLDIQLQDKGTRHNLRIQTTQAETRIRINYVAHKFVPNKMTHRTQKQAIFTSSIPQEIFA